MHDPDVPFTAKSIGCDYLALQYEDVANKNDLNEGETIAWMLKYLPVLKPHALAKAHRAAFATEFSINEVHVTVLFPRVGWLTGCVKDDLKIFARTTDPETAMITSQMAALRVGEVLTLMQ